MATDKNITMKQYNGSDYDTLYPATKGSQIITPVPVASGGLGANTAAAGVNNIITPLSTITPASNDIIPLKDVSANTGVGATITQLVSSLSSSGVVTSSNIAEQAAAAGFGRIQTGSYVGTGTYGASNPCSLTFDFKPDFFMVWERSAFGTGAVIRGGLLPTFVNVIYTVDAGRGSCATLFGDSTVKYYDTSKSAKQYNDSGNMYYYIAASCKSDEDVFLFGESTTFVVPKTGNYYLELHGGGGGSGHLSSGTYYRGGMSGQTYSSISLTAGTSISVIVGAAGINDYSYEWKGSDGGITSFGDYSVQGGGGAPLSSSGGKGADYGNTLKSDYSSGGIMGVFGVGGLGSSDGTLRTASGGCVYLEYLGT